MATKVAVNDIATPDNLAYPLRHDTVDGRFSETVAAQDSHLAGDQRRTAGLVRRRREVAERRVGRR